MEIQKKIYYRISFRLCSPLAVGSGQKEETDKDMVRDGRGVPYLPATAIAGVTRPFFDKEEGIRYFGEVKDSVQAKRALENLEQTSTSSRIIFYDATICKEDLDKYRIRHRDSVALDEWKTAKKGAKFDMEVLEPEVRFVTYMEQNLYEDDEEAAEKIAAAWKSEVLRFGGKTMRGYGEISDVSVKKRVFCFKQTAKADRIGEEDAAAWLAFDMYDEEQWSTQPEWESCEKLNIRECHLELQLKLKGGISIRRYAAGTGEKFEPDFEQLTILDGKTAIPVIPGTTWCGAFRNQIRRLIPGIDESYFGTVSQTGKIKSKIRFGESRIIKAKEKILMHNAIDRFDGGTIDTALFTERTFYSGTTKLTISFGADIPDSLLDGLAAAIADLHYGFLSVGGMTGVGRGIFEVESINGKRLKQDAVLGQEAVGQYQQIKTVLRELREECHG